ncbi:uncharacterized protein LOC124813438 isoform X2 [Hydra vulgaris]|uniref:Uncharacterized protein LOC124813438 isoform X2 n=1 Tax=Hydra vulgaris TaxID=6087 RepID=A0ABM4CX57_HYDVU
MKHLFCLLNIAVSRLRFKMKCFFSLLVLFSTMSAILSLCAPKVKTLNNCREVCERVVGCYGFNYVPANKICFLKDKPWKWRPISSLGSFSGFAAFNMTYQNIDFNQGDMDDCTVNHKRMVKDKKYVNPSNKN